jgi:hypothetical protein
MVLDKERIHILTACEPSKPLKSLVYNPDWECKTAAWNMQNRRMDWSATSNLNNSRI